MRVYRLEHSTLPDTTPYRIFDDFYTEDELNDLVGIDTYYEIYRLSSKICTAHASSEFPCSHVEFPKFTPEYHFAGCTSLTQLFTWFRGFLDDLFNLGFHVVIYEVPDADVISSEKQCIFPMHLAQRVATL